MTRDEIKTMLNLIGGAYSTFTRAKGVDELKAMVNAWYLVLHPYDKDISFKALQNYLIIGRYAPTPTDILTEIMNLTYPSIDKDIETLFIASKRAEKGEIKEDFCADRIAQYRLVDNSENEFRKLPEHLRIYIQNPKRLKEFHLKADELIYKEPKEKFKNDLAIAKYQVETEKIQAANAKQLTQESGE